MTKNRTLLRLVRSAYLRAQVTKNQALVVWNSRIYLDESMIVMESACPIYLDKIVEQLRIFTGETSKPHEHFVWVRVVGNAAQRWMSAKRRPHQEPVAQATSAEGR